MFKLFVCVVMLAVLAFAYGDIVEAKVTVPTNLIDNAKACMGPFRDALLAKMKGVFKFSFDFDVTKPIADLMACLSDSVKGQCVVIYPPIVQ